MEQRRSMNLTNSLSSDVFGDVAEGSVGEFLKNVPGVDVDYVGPDARGPRLRGLDPQYVGVSVDGMTLASADGSQALGGGARSFSFDQVSVNSLDRIEVNYTTSADQDADSPAGTINLKTKRAFERKGRRLSWQVNVMANGDFDWRRSYGPSDTHPQVPPRRHPRILRRVFPQPPRPRVQPQRVQPIRRSEPRGHDLQRRAHRRRSAPARPYQRQPASATRASPSASRPRSPSTGRPRRPSSSRSARCITTSTPSSTIAPPLSACPAVAPL
jgi:hypothetical protein